MTTKKIGSGEELNGLLRGLTSNFKKKNKVTGQEGEEANENSAVDGRVNIELSKSINTELSPEILLSERSEKINKLKELIKSGKYNPKSEDIAAALEQDIVFEILSSPKEAVNE